MFGVRFEGEQLLPTLGNKTMFSVAPSLSLLRCGEVIFLEMRREMKIRMAMICYKSRDQAAKLRSSQAGGDLGLDRQRLIR